jgi:hypothetical protein
LEAMTDKSGTSLLSDGAPCTASGDDTSDFTN